VLKGGCVRVGLEHAPLVLSPDSGRQDSALPRGEPLTREPQSVAQRMSFMPWMITREHETVRVDLRTVEPDEGGAAAVAARAELTVAPAAQVVIYAGEPPAPSFRRALVESIAITVEDQGGQVRVVYTERLD
jgi:hypothetical protein